MLFVEDDEVGVGDGETGGEERRDLFAPLLLLRGVLFSTRHAGNHKGIALRCRCRSGDQNPKPNRQRPKRRGHWDLGLGVDECFTATPSAGAVTHSAPSSIITATKIQMLCQSS